MIVLRGFYSLSLFFCCLFCLLLCSCSTVSPSSFISTSTAESKVAQPIFPVSADSACQAPETFLIGKWHYDNNDSPPVHLVLISDGYVFYEFQNAAGRASKMYEGSWEYLDENILRLSLTLSYSDSSSNKEQIPQSLEGTYQIKYPRSDNFTLTARENSPSLVPNAQEDASFTRILYPSDDPDHSCIHTDHCIHTIVCGAAMDHYELNCGHRPDSSRIAATRPTGFLIHLYDKQNSQIISCAWYIIDPETMTGYDYFTGETVDLNHIASDHDEISQTSSGYDNSAVCAAAISYHEKTYNYRPAYAAVDGVQSDGYLIRLYNETPSHSASCGWYVIDPDSMLGYDYITGEKINFSEQKS